MKKTVISLVCLLVTIALIGCSKSKPANAKNSKNGNSTPMAQKLDLKIFYAGKPGSKRQKAFVTFLSQHFSQVKTGDLAAFDGSQAVGSDVTIFDYDGEDLFNAPLPQIDQDYRAPTVTIGVVGANICSGLARVTGYM